MEQMTTLRDLVGQVIQKKEEEKRIAEEQAAKDRSWKIPICYDDDEDNTIAITPVLPIKEPDNSLSMGDEHLDTIPTTESDEVIKSSVEDLVPIPSEIDVYTSSYDDSTYAFTNVDNDHLKESSGNTTTHVDFSQYDSFIFDLSNDQFPPADRSDFNHEEFADELTHIMSLPNLECFKFKIEPDLGDLTSIDLGSISRIVKTLVLAVST
ncbi:hypothetical protein Tco_0682729 [Tanacetum coccineum]|uniref:Reverse transcriptase domain-containing protein n=1 Tax=Tanacetum coccineum TaxID=301880 RepID=A0ABQ4XRZ3_9ASTR